MVKNIKIFFGFFLTIMFFRYVPHLPNFTPVLAMTFYGTLIFGRSSLTYIVLAYAVSDLFIGFHNQLIWTWGSLFLVGFIGPYFKTLFGRFTGVFFSSVIFFMLTNLGVFLSGYYGFGFESLFLCYTLAIPFFTNTLLSTMIFTILIEFLIFSKFFNFIPLIKNKTN